jgi:hypothetical protein
MSLSFEFSPEQRMLEENVWQRDIRGRESEYENPAAGG